MLHSFVSLAYKFRMMFLLVLVFEGKKVMPLKTKIFENLIFRCYPVD